jgi:hypothetical protein
VSVSDCCVSTFSFTRFPLLLPQEEKKKFEIKVNSWLPLVDTFRTLNWAQIKRDLEVSKIFEVFQEMALQN